MLTSISSTQCSRHHFTSINSLVLPAPSFLIDSVCYRLYTVGRRLSVCLLFTSTRDGCAQRQEQTCYLLLPLIRAEDLLPSVHTSNIISFRISYSTHCRIADMTPPGPNAEFITLCSGSTVTESWLLNVHQPFAPSTTSIYRPP